MTYASSAAAPTVRSLCSVLGGGRLWVLRGLGAQDPNGGQSQSAFGWGASPAGAPELWGGDVLTAGVAGGQGLAAYFHGTGGLGLDAAVTSIGQFIALPSLGAYVGYTRRWTSRWSSTAS